MPERLLAGACAGLCYWVGTFPLDAIKVSTCTLLKEFSFQKNSSFKLCVYSVGPAWLNYSTSFIIRFNIVSDSSLRIFPCQSLHSLPLISSYSYLLAQARVQASPYETRQGWLKTAQTIYREGLFISNMRLAYACQRHTFKTSSNSAQIKYCITKSHTYTAFYPFCCIHTYFMSFSMLRISVRLSFLHDVTMNYPLALTHTLIHSHTSSRPCTYLSLPRFHRLLLTNDPSSILSSLLLLF